MTKNKENSTSDKSFWIGFILILLLTSGVAVLLQGSSKPLIHPGFWLIQGFFAVISVASHLLSSMGIKNRSEFHTFYLGSMSVRFLLSLFFILISLFYLPDNHITYVANFFILYIVYASFEIYHLSRNLRADSEKNAI